MPKVTKDTHRSLHPSLVPKAHAIMGADVFEDTVTKACINNLVGEALQLCRTLDCLVEILPKGCIAIEENWEEIFGKGGPLSQEEIDSFHARNVKGQEAIGQLFMKDLITGC